MNTFGKIFRVTTHGESHGRAIGCVVDGCPSGLELSEEDIQKELDRRKPGQSDVTTPRGEEDKVEILSGVFDGRTLGTPISLLICNKDVDSSKYEELKNKPRPGHGDFTWREKFGHVDWRGGGRGSARETAMRVAAGAIAKKLLGKSGIEILAYAREIAGVGVDLDFNEKEIAKYRDIIESNSVRTIDPGKAKEMENAVLKAKKDGDSVGGVIEIAALGVPAGLGEPVFYKLDASIACALMSIPAVKGVEIGKGFGLAAMKGSEANDEFIVKEGKVKTITNNCGGILGGISDGMPIIARVAVKPTSSISRKQRTVDLGNMGGAEIEIKGRHDPCIVPRAVPVCEAMMALVLADLALIQGLIPKRLTD